MSSREARVESSSESAENDGLRRVSTDNVGWMYGYSVVTGRNIELVPRWCNTVLNGGNIWWCEVDKTQSIDIVDRLMLGQCIYKYTRELIRKRLGLSIYFSYVYFCLHGHLWLDWLDWTLNRGGQQDFVGLGRQNPVCQCECLLFSTDSRIWLKVQFFDDSPRGVWFWGRRLCTFP